MKHLSTILAFAVLLTVGLACGGSDGATTLTGSDTTATKASGGAVSVESVTMTNAAGEKVTNFKTTDNPQKFSVKLSEFGAAKVKGVFTVVNAGGEKDMKLLEKELETTSMTNTADFKLSLDTAFPAGDYKMDVFLNEKLAKTVNYKVQ